jgi:superfamily II DNA or RNA helicase
MTRTERQMLGLQKWADANFRGTLCYGVGVGKTRTALTAVQKFLEKNPTGKVVVVVPTKVLKEQWKEAAEKMGLSLNIKIANTAAKKKFDCDFLVLDELHHYSSPSFRKVFLTSKPRLILGLTATYERLDGLEKEVVDKYCPVCDIITYQEAEKNGWVSPCRVYKVILDVDLKDYEAANRQFMSCFAMFGYDFNLAMSLVSDWRNQITYAHDNNFELKEVRQCTYGFNHALQFRKSFIANHPHKIEVAKQILAARPQAKAITFNGSIAQCQAYGNGIVVHSNNSKKQNDELIKQFSEAEGGAIIHSAKMLDEGFNVEAADLAIITGFNSSKHTATQRKGRVSRAYEGKIAEVYWLVLKNTVEDKWWQNANEGAEYYELNEEELQQVLNDPQSIQKTLKVQSKVRHNFSA